MLSLPSQPLARPCHVRADRRWFIEAIGWPRPKNDLSKQGG